MTSLELKLAQMEGIIGEIRLFSGDSEPKDWAFCDGRVLNTALYTAFLYILSDDYFLPGKVGFRLPNLPDLETPNGKLRYIICLRGIFPHRD